jgi:Flp pilus assembly protein TadG
MKRSVWSLWGNADGAVAPTVALSLTALIAAGGIAFDYSRMASMDTELQSAADQAALAAAAQLDGNDGACTRAAAAANGMLVNRTYMSNDGNGTAINVPLESTCDDSGQIRFYKDAAKTQEATIDADAKFVEVEVDPRKAFYAFTPIVAAFNSGQMHAVAFAGLDSAICKVPPLMLCNPNETADPEFTTANYIGDGIRLVANDGGGIYGPGNFGFLDTAAGNGATALRELLGASNVPGDCVKGDTVDTETGSIITVRDALNTRFGIYDTGSLNQPCGNTGSGCPPSANIRQDLLLKGSGNTEAKLGFITGVGGNGWEEGPNPYPGVIASMTQPVTPHALSATEINAIAPMGYPEDICHAFSETGSCAGGRIGNGVWDRYAYFKSNSANYPEMASIGPSDLTAFNNFLTTTFGTTTPTRYKVYQTEMAAASTRMRTQSSGSLSAVSNPSLLSGEPAGVTPNASQIDRRVLTVAVIDCTAEGVSGHTTNIQVMKWIDIFLTQPSVARSVGMPTENSDIYVEMIGQTENATNEGAVQLVKKSVPYLIE